MNFYRKAMRSRVVYIVWIILAGGFFANEVAAQGASDDFEGGTAGNNYFDGGSGWDGYWIVSSTARVSVVTQSGSKRLNLSNGCNAYREVDLSSASSATLTFDFEDSSNDETYVDISTDGGTNWTLGSTAYTSNGSYSVDLSSYTLTANFLIRFRSTGNNDNDDVYIDNVQITTVVRAVSLIVDDQYSEDQTVSVTISRNGPTTSAVTVDLDSSDTSIAEFAVASVTIGIGASQTTVNLTLKDIDGIQTVTLTITDQATPDVYLGDTEEVKVIDNDFAGSYSGDSIGSPTFLMTASYDWLHNFYDDNAKADGTKTDRDTDNFNKIIMVDSNLFPIYTALKGDQEWPNIVMRNWTSGPGTGSPTSPSVNDYMNRSVAVVANYLNTTTRTPITYERFATVNAVGMRTHPEWAFVVDPANANFRRYKFIKIADVAYPAWYDGNPDGDVEELNPGTDPDDLHKCDNCCPGTWYIGTPGQLLCDIPSNDSCCPSTNGSCYDADTRLMYAPKEAQNTACGGSTATVDYMACTNTSADGGIPGSGNFGHYDNYGGACTDDTASKSEAEKASPPSPYGRFPIFLTNDQVSGSTVDVTFSFKGHTHSTDAGVVFVLNGSAKGVDDIGEGCECERFALKQGSDWGVNDASPCQPGTPGASGACRSEYSVTFSGVPSKCALDFDDEYKVMYVDLYPCDHGGMVIEVPKFDPKDNAFQIPVPGVDPSDGISTAEQTIIDTRWANLTAYLDIVPPKSYPGYGQYTSATLRTIGYGYTTNTAFTHARNVRFKDPRDIDAYRDYFDVQNGAPAYIFVADTMNSRIQVFMNATGSAGEPNASFPIRPVRIKAPTDKGTGETTSFTSNEVAMRLYSTTDTGTLVSIGPGDGRKADWRNYTTVSGTGSGTDNRTLDNQSRIPANAGRGEFYYPHSVAVDQDPDTKDVYLFVADTFNHRIQIFRDTTGVTNQPITNKRFDFKYEEGWGTYPLQTTLTVTPPGPFGFRYPKGVDLVRFANNSSYLYVVDSKNYRLMKYLVSEGSASDGITGVEAVNAYGYDGSNFVAGLFSQQGTPMTASNTNPGFLNPQDVATGYSGFYIFTSPAGKGTQFLNNYMVYVSDYARNNTSLSRDYLNMRVQQFIQVPTFANLSGSWIPWNTEAVKFGSWTSNNLALGQSVYGISDGFYNSSSIIRANIVEGSTENVPGKPGYFTDRPVGLATLQWNTKKPIDIRVVKESTPTAVYVNGGTVPRSSQIRIGVSSRYLFMPPEDDYDAFRNSSTEVSETAKRWDGLYAGRVHVFCYDKYGQFDNHSALPAAPYRITLSSMGCQTNGFAKIVAEDRDFAYSGRTGTMFFRIGN